MPANPQDIRYDVFISYRRESTWPLAHLFQFALRDHNISAFLDRQLGHGVFNETLLQRIAEASARDKVVDLWLSWRDRL